MYIFIVGKIRVPWDFVWEESNFLWTLERGTNTEMGEERKLRDLDRKWRSFVKVCEANQKPHCHSNMLFCWLDDTGSAKNQHYSLLFCLMHIWFTLGLCNLDSCLFRKGVWTMLWVFIIHVRQKNRSENRNILLDYIYLTCSIMCYLIWYHHKKSKEKPFKSVISPLFTSERGERKNCFKSKYIACEI